MNKYILNTESESGDNYTYLLKSEKNLKENSKELKKFLKSNQANDPGYEFIEFFEEINDSEFILI